MKIVKVINGEKHEFNIITKHNDLQERDSYGCHPISAIRNLPEKISALKEKDADLQKQITDLKEAEVIDTTARNNVAEAKQSIGNIETNAKNINLSETNGELKFTNYEGKSATFRSGNEVDNSTIELVNNKISLKKVFTTEDLNGDGTETNPLNLVNKPDGYTLVTRDNKLEVAGLRSASGLVTAKYISDITLDLQEQITKNEEDIEKINVENDTQNNKIYSLETITKGLGGYLNSYDFGLNPTQEELTQYAITDTGVKNRNEIFNGTKVINTFNKHVWVLTNTPNSTPAIFNWEDLGKVQDISIATDSTFGLVKSSTNEFEGEINTLGHISINGLEEELNDIKSGYVTKEELEDKNYLTEIPSTYVTDGKLNDTLSNYYTKSQSYNKSEIDNLIDNIPQGENVDLSNYYTKEEINNLIPEQPNLDNYYTKNDTYSKLEVDNLIPEPTNLSNYYNKEETYSKSEVNNLINNIDLNDYVTKSETYSKEEVGNLVSNKQDKLTPGNNITISDDGVISSATDLSDYYTKEQVDNLIPEPTDLSNYYTKSQVYTKEEVNDIIPEPVNLSNYYTKTEVDNLIPSQTQVDVINKVDTLPEASETSSDLVQVDEKLYYKKVSESTQGVDNITYEYNKLLIQEDVNNRIRYLMNENILLNGDFSINQRGETSYSGKNIYSVDRWRLDSSFAFANQNDNLKWIFGISGTNEIGYNKICSQVIEKFDIFTDEKVTASMKYYEFNEDVAGTTELCIFDGYSTSKVALNSGNGFVKVTHTVHSNATCLIVSLVSNNGKNCSIIPKWLKLEIGENATLFMPRQPAEELFLCQRYFQNIKLEGQTGCVVSTAMVQPVIVLSNNLRTKPIITMVQYPLIWGDAKGYNSKSFTYKYLENNYISFLLQAEISDSTQNLSTKSMKILRNGKMTVDAEIYDDNLIEFTIDGETYYAESEMTWEEWCESSYSTDNNGNKTFIINSGYVQNTTYNHVILDAKSSDLIESGKAYIFSSNDTGGAA